MGNRTKRPPGRTKGTPQRPSLFFVIALLAGLILLGWFFVQSLNRAVPATGTTATTTT